jgi:c(7)-type cytochrome triheme protein
MKKMFVAAMIIGSLSIPFVALAEPAGGADLTFTPRDAPSVVFSHDKHLKKWGLKCSGCHYRFFQMAKGSYKMDMGKITKGRFCGRCHNGRASFDVQDPKNCSCCHR